MRLTRLHWYGFLAVLLGLGVLIGINQRGSAPVSSASPQVPLESPSTHPNEPQGRLKGAVLVEQDETSSAWEVYAEEAILYETQGVAVAQGVRAELFQDQQTLWWLQADEGEVHQHSGNMAVKGHVRVRHQAGYTILTEALDWEAESRQLQTDRRVDIQGPTVRITGMGLRSDVDQQRFSLERDVRASFRLRKRPAQVDRK